MFAHDVYIYLLDFTPTVAWKLKFGGYYLPYGINAMYSSNAVFYLTGDTDKLYFGKFDINGTFIT